MCLEILSHLDLAMVGIVAQVSKNWNQMANPAARVTSSDKARRMRCLRLRRDGRISKLLRQLSGSAAGTRWIYSHPGTLYDDIISAPHVPHWYIHNTFTENPNITIDMLLEYNISHGFGSYPYHLSCDSTITYEELTSHGLYVSTVSVCALTYAEYVKLNLVGELRYMFYRSGKITPSDITANIDEFKDHYRYLMMNENIPMLFLLEHFNITVNGKLTNCTFSEQEIRRVLKSSLRAVHTVHTLRIEYQSLLAAEFDRNIALFNLIISHTDIVDYFDKEFILNNLQWDWNRAPYGTLHQITICDRLAHPEFPWNWDRVDFVLQAKSCNVAPSEAVIMYEKMCEDGTMTIEDVDRETGWHWPRLAAVASLDIQALIVKFMASDEYTTRNSAKFGAALSRRDDLTIDIVLKYTQIQWNYLEIVDNLYKKIMRADS